MPKREFEKLLAGRGVDETKILRWSREARKLKRAKKLPVLSSLKSLR